MEVEERKQRGKASYNYRKLHGTGAWRFSQASKVRALEIRRGTQPRAQSNLTDFFPFRKQQGAHGTWEKAALNGYVITALLTIVQNMEKSLFGGCKIPCEKLQQPGLRQ